MQWPEMSSKLNLVEDYWDTCACVAQECKKISEFDRALGICTDTFGENQCSCSRETGKVYAEEVLSGVA